jgi:uncharacterized membrane protein YcjF (UPF0283 family)
MKRAIDVICFAIGFTIIALTDFVRTQSGKLLIRMGFILVLVSLGVELFSMDNIENDFKTSGASFWETQGAGYVLLLLAAIVVFNTFLRPLIKELNKKGYQIGRSHHSFE